MTVIARLMALIVLALPAACGASGDVEEETTPTDALPPPPDPIPNEGPIVVPTNLVCPTGTHLTYENFGEGFLRNYCTSCHSKNVPEAARGGAPVTANFDGPSDAALWRAGMLAKAGTDAGVMPPVNNVSSLERQQFAEWLNCGAPGR